MGNGFFAYVVKKLAKQLEVDDQDVPDVTVASEKRLSELQHTLTRNSDKADWMISYP